MPLDEKQSVSILQVIWSKIHDFLFIFLLSRDRKNNLLSAGIACIEASHRYGLLLQMAWCGLCAGHDRKAVQKRLAAGYAFWGRLAWAPVH